jgi:hypothetical protein
MSGEEIQWQWLMVPQFWSMLTIKDNKKNILYFANTSMQGIHKDMEEWQNVNKKRFLSVSIQPDNGKFWCIALTNPTEVVIVSGISLHDNQAKVVNGNLRVIT